MKIYAAITNHGFGHAVRSAGILADIFKKHPDTEIIINSKHPVWIWQSLLKHCWHKIKIRNIALDAALIMNDSVTINHKKSIEALEYFYHNRNKIIDSECKHIEENKCDLVIGDIPPIAAKIAHKAGLPCIMWGNFGWDFIYFGLGKKYFKYAEHAADDYKLVLNLFQMPFNENMQNFPHKISIGVSGNKSKFSRKQLLNKLGLGEYPVCLITFGGVGQQINYNLSQEFNGLNKPRWQFITFSKIPGSTGIKKIDNNHWRVNDVLPICNVVLTKPGYGILADCYQNKTPIISIKQLGSPETPILLDNIQNYFTHKFIKADDLNKSWDFLLTELRPAQMKKRIKTDGNKTITDKIFSLQS